jgi:hypothetical protein
MRKEQNTTGINGDGLQEAEEVRRISDVLDDLLAAYSAQFPQFKFVLVSPADSPGSDRLEAARMTPPAWNTRS